MKVRKLAWPILPLCLVSLVGLSACEEKTDEAGEAPKAAETGAEAAKPAEPPKPEPPKEPPVPPPADACTALVTAIKAKDDAKVLAASTEGTAAALAVEGAKDHVMTVLANAACGAAKVEADGQSATVAATAGDAAQELPFIKGKDGWKFDGGAYLAKYPVPEKAAKTKAGKGAKPAKKAGKKKHHG